MTQTPTPEPTPKRPSLLLQVVQHVGRIVQRLCNDPTHLQRLGIVGAGMAMYPLVIAPLLIVTYGNWDVPHAVERLGIVNNLALSYMVMWGLVVVAVLGIVRGVKATLPGGASFEVDIDSNDERTKKRIRYGKDAYEETFLGKDGEAWKPTDEDSLPFREED